MCVQLTFGRGHNHHHFQIDRRVGRRLSSRTVAGSSSQTFGVASLFIFPRCSWLLSPSSNRARCEERRWTGRHHGSCQSDVFRRRSFPMSFHVDVGLEETVCSWSVTRFVSMNIIVVTVVMVLFISRGFVTWVREFAHWSGISQKHGRQTLTDSWSLHVLGHLFGSVSATKF